MTYKFEECSYAQTEGGFYQTPKPSGLFVHSLAPLSILENIVYQKYVLGTSLYRQLEDSHCLIWNVCGATLTGWVIRSATNGLKQLMCFTAYKPDQSQKRNKNCMTVLRKLSSSTVAPYMMQSTAKIGLAVGRTCAENFLRPISLINRLKNC